MDRAGIEKAAEDILNEVTDCEHMYAKYKDENDPTLLSQLQAVSEFKRDGPRAQAYLHGLQMEGSCNDLVQNGKLD